MNKILMMLIVGLVAVMPLQGVAGGDTGAWNVSGFMDNGHAGMRVTYDFLNPKTHQFKPEVLGPDGLTESERKEAYSGGGEKGWFMSFCDSVATTLKMKEHPLLWTFGASVATFCILENNTSMDLIDGFGKDNGSDANKYIRRAKELEEQEKAEQAAAEKFAEFQAFLAAVEAAKTEQGQ